jgi:ribosomal protein S27E
MLAAHDTSTATRGSYARRQPETTVLYRVVRDLLPALLDHARDRSEHGFGYPRFVEREFEKFLSCGLLCRGFVRVRCGDCAEERLVAFSCKTRGFCPSCTTRRMAGTAAHLVENVLPAVPYRQWVLSLPRQVRFLLARDGDLLSQVLGVFLHKVFAWQRRRARTYGIADPHGGAVTFVQRFGSLLNLNCHAHALLPDGVFAADPDGVVRFCPLPPPWDDDVARLLDQIARAIHRLVERHRASRGDDPPPDLLASEQARAVADSPSRGRAPFPRPTGRRSAFLDGYSLHADRLVDTDDRDGLERLARNGARSPVANSRLSLDPSGRVVLALKRPLRHLRRRDADPRHPARGRRQPLHSRAPRPTHRAASAPRRRSTRAGVRRRLTAPRFLLRPCRTPDGQLRASQDSARGFSDVADTANAPHSRPAGKACQPFLGPLPETPVCSTYAHDAAAQIVKDLKSLVAFYGSVAKQGLAIVLYTT